MKKLMIYIMALVAIFTFAGCSKSKATTSQTNTPGTTANDAKTKVAASNQNNQSKLDQIKLDYQNKRTAAEQERISSYNDTVNSGEQDRVNFYNSRVNYITAELQKRNEEQLGLINTKYTNDAAAINGSSLADQDKATALSNAYNTKSQSQTSQTMLYETSKVQLERIKRTYAENIQKAKDIRDTSEANFKKTTTQKYDGEFDKLTSTHAGDGSDWDVLLKKEQKELTDYYAGQDKKYNDYVKQVNKWLDDSLNALLF